MDHIQLLLVMYQSALSTTHAPLFSPYETKYGKESSGYRIHRGFDPQYGMPEVAIVVELIPLGHCIINLVQCNVCP